MKDEFLYQGNELQLFSHAINWKKYVTRKIKRYITGDVAEVGPGPGNFSSFLIHQQLQSWTFIEPDARYVKTIYDNSGNYSLPIKIVTGTLGDISSTDKFDSIIYLDVLEHIKNDKAEVHQMISHIKPKGYIIILCPAFNFLYSAFDKEIGHYRRYTKRDLLQLFPSSADIITCRYLDSAGFLASLFNSFLLRQSYPTLRQIKFWDRLLVPLSKLTDILFSNYFGRSVLLVVQVNRKNL